VLSCVLVLEISSVIFSAIRKWDGTSQRMLEAGEYVQMAGRAGRRGKDTVGTVLLYTAPADFPSENEVKQLLTGAHKRMKSQFRLTYNMILNLMRVDELRVEDVMSRSFSEAPAGRDSSRWKKLVANGEKQLKGLDRRGHELDRFRDLHQMSLRVRALNESLALLLSNMKKLASSAAFQTGRVLIVDRGDGGFAIACITKSVMTRTAKLGLRAASSPASTSGSGDKLCRVAVLLGGPATASSSSPFYAMQGSSVGIFGDCTFNVGGVRLAIIDVPSARVHAFTSLVVSLNEQGMNPLRGDPKAEALSSTAELLQEVANNSSYWTAMPLMEVSDIALKDLNESALWSERNELVRCMCEMFTRLSAVAGTRDLAEAMHELDREIALRRKVNELQMAASDESLQLMPDFRQRVEVLKRLGYADGGRVLLKGRAMCEVNCCELILVELCFENVLQRMSAAPMAALLSALVFQGRSGGNAEDDSKALERLRDASVELYDAAVAVRRILMSIGGVQAECGLPVSPLDYAVNQANFGLSEAVLTWAQGRPFTEVCCIVPDVAEGTIVRGIVRLSELLREVKNVGRIIGDMVLQDLADEATNAVKRDVIFAASLYVT
jgi:antiviral helicase SKI2